MLERIGPDREHRDRHRRRHREPDAQREVRRRRAEDDAQDRAEEDRPYGQLGLHFVGRDEGPVGGADRLPGELVSG